MAPPQVISLSPRDGQSVRASRVEIAARFSEAMDPASLDASSFQLSSMSGSPVDGSVSYDTGERRAVFTPVSSLAPGQYNATVSQTGSDLNGNALSQASDWIFDIPVETTITGTIVSATGAPVPGASVRIGERYGIAFSDSIGRFSFPGLLLDPGETIDVTAISGQESRLVAGVVPLHLDLTDVGTIRFEGSGELCDPAWANGLFQPQGLDGQVQAFEEFDDGSGTALYVGVSIPRVNANDISIAYVARWNGSGWIRLPGIIESDTADPFITSMRSFDGALHVAGRFTSIGGVPVSSMARWNGQGWAPIPGEMVASMFGVEFPGVVTDMEVYDDGNGARLYVGGQITRIDELEVNSVAIWDGDQWTSEISTKLEDRFFNGQVDAMRVWNGELYLGGRFSVFDEDFVQRRGIVRWDGNEIRDLEASFTQFGSNPSIVDIETFQDDLYITGGFDMNGDDALAGIARWDGESWSYLDGGLTGENFGQTFAADGRALEVYDDGRGEKLFVAGSFGFAGGVEVATLAAWDGFEWSDPGLGGGSQFNPINQMMAFENELFLGGSLINAGGIPVQNVAKLSGQEWMSAGDGIERISIDLNRFRRDVITLGQYDDGSGPRLIAAGFFNFAGGVDVNGIAQRVSGTWQPMGSGLVEVFRNDVHAVLQHGDDLFVGGTGFGENADQLIRRWDGSEWSTPGQGIGGSSGLNAVKSLAVYNKELYAAGDFNTFTGAPADHLLVWDGETWLPVGDGSIPRLNDLVVFNDGENGPRLYAAGQIMGGSYVRAWDGEEWSNIASTVGFQELIHMTVHDDGSGSALYAIDRETQVVKLVEDTWVPVGSPIDADGNFDAAHDILSYDDGSGARLIAVGDFRDLGEHRRMEWGRMGDVRQWSKLPGRQLHRHSGSGWCGIVSGRTIHERG